MCRLVFCIVCLLFLLPLVKSQIEVERVERITQRLIEKGFDETEDCTNYKDGKLPAGSDKSGCILKDENDQIIFLFRKYMKPTVTEATLTRDLKILTTLMEEKWTVPQVLSPPFSCTVLNWKHEEGNDATRITYGFLAQNVQSTMRGPWKPQNVGFLEGFQPYLSQLREYPEFLNAMRDLHKITIDLMCKRENPDLQILLQNIGLDSGRVFMIDPPKSMPVVNGVRPANRELLNALDFVCQQANSMDNKEIHKMYCDPPRCPGSLLEFKRKLTHRPSKILAPGYPRGI